MLTWHIWPGSTLQEEEDYTKWNRSKILPIDCFLFDDMLIGICPVVFWTKCEAVCSTIVCELCVCVYSQEVEKLKVFSPGKIRVEDHFLTKS